MLAAFEKNFRSSDFDEVRENLTQTFTSHRLTLDSKSSKLLVDVGESEFGDSALVYVSYGAPVQVEADELDKFYLFQMQRTGHLDVTLPNAQRLCDADVLSVLPPDKAFRLNWMHNTSALTIKLSRSAIQRNYTAMTGSCPVTPIVFEPFVLLNTSVGESWRNLVNFVQTQLSLQLAKDHHLSCHLEDAVARFALQALPHNFSDAPSADSYKGLPKAVARAKSFIDTHIADSLSMTAVTQVSGVSQVTLCKQFKQHLEVSPQAYIRGKRLEAVRVELVSADATSSVAELAFKHGFNHQGRFSNYYKDRFGELPSTTLRKQS